jgi:arsenate reductase (thioredoxin)
MVSMDESRVKKRVLFLCTGNSARSQMAEALLPLIADDQVEVFSAGTQPVGLNPAAVEAMQELGVDISHQRSKHLEEFLGDEFDYVITVCDRAKETCPIFPAADRLLHWSFVDPAAALEDQRRDVFRRVRDEIADRLSKFIIEEQISPPGRSSCAPSDF